MAEPSNAAAFIADADIKVLEALLVRLSPKWIYRMRSVCKAWRDKLRDETVLAALHRVQPPRPLLCFNSAACPNDRYLHLRNYRVECLDLPSGNLRSLIRFTDSEFYDRDNDNLWGRYAPPICDKFRVDYEMMEEENYVLVDGYKESLFMVHGSINGYLLVTFAKRSYVINPATRHWVWLPYLDNLGELQAVGFYEHVPSGDYRVLCFTGRGPVDPPAPNCWYHVLHVSPVSLRYIGRPISPAAAAPEGEDPRIALAYGVSSPCISSPIQFKRNHHLHWPPERMQQDQMLVFDTEREEFSWKRFPPLVGRETRLLEFPNGDLGLSLSRMNMPMLELWRLEDYQNEVWVPVYQIQLGLQQMPRQVLDDFWVPSVVSPEGDVLILSFDTNWVLHCDRNGNLLRQFWFPKSATASVSHVLRENLLPHPMFLAPKVDGATEPPFFHGLCSDLNS